MHNFANPPYVSVCRRLSPFWPTVMGALQGAPCFLGFLRPWALPSPLDEIFAHTTLGCKSSLEEWRHWFFKPPGLWSSALRAIFLSKEMTSICKPGGIILTVLLVFPAVAASRLKINNFTCRTPFTCCLLLAGCCRLASRHKLASCRKVAARFFLPQACPKRTASLPQAMRLPLLQGSPFAAYH